MVWGEGEMMEGFGLNMYSYFDSIRFDSMIVMLLI